MPPDPKARRKVIVSTWDRLGGKPVGEKMLRAIQRALREKLGANGLDSPAAIARVLADEGAELRHPEVIEFDARWRAAALKKQKAVDPGPAPEKALTFAQVIHLIRKWEKTRAAAVRRSDSANLRHVREMAIAEKQRAESLAGKTGLNTQLRAEQAEIAEWIRVWLLTPDLFPDWLDLRRQTADFRKRFPSSDPK